MKGLAVLVLLVACLGCGRTVQEEYESALNIYIMEKQRLDQLEKDGSPRDPGGQVYYAKDWSKRVERVTKAKMMLERAEAAFYGD
jgi:hypothetical protein